MRPWARPRVQQAWTRRSVWVPWGWRGSLGPALGGTVRSSARHGQAGHTVSVSLQPEDAEAVRRFQAWKHRPRQPGQDDDGLTTPQSVYADQMKAAFAPALRGAGLRGSGGRFELPSACYWAQLGFQKSAYSSGDQLRFTINLSVIPRDEWARQSTAKPYLGKHPTPSTQYGAWAKTARIGQLTPRGEDKWWRILRGADAAAVRDDALHDLLTYAVPWLRQQTPQP
jgi:hypothetical protein